VINSNLHVNPLTLSHTHVLRTVHPLWTDDERTDKQTTTHTISSTVT